MGRKSCWGKNGNPTFFVSLEDKRNELFIYEGTTGESIKYQSPSSDSIHKTGKLAATLIQSLENAERIPGIPPYELLHNYQLKNRIIRANNYVLTRLLQEKKIIDGLYQNRVEPESKLQEWIGSHFKIFFIAAKAGAGKTNLLEYIRKEYWNRDENGNERYNLFLRASRMTKGRLEEEIKYVLNFHREYPLKRFTILRGTQATPRIVLIDGINEHPNPQQLWAEIRSLASLYEHGTVKFVVTCRVNSNEELNQYKIEKDAYRWLYPAKDKATEFSASSDKDQLSDYALWLAPFNMVELESAWNKYVIKFPGLKPTFEFSEIGYYDQRIYEIIKEPLQLRLFLKIYGGKQLPKEKSTTINIWKEWFNQLKAETRDYLLILAELFWKNGKNFISGEELRNNEKLASFGEDNHHNHPLQVLLNDGWVNDFTKDKKAVYSFTLEACLHYVSALQLHSTDKTLGSKEVKSILEENNIYKAGVIGVLLNEQLQNDDFKTVAHLIREEEISALCIDPIINLLLNRGPEFCVEALFNEPEEQEWEFLMKFTVKLEELQQHEIRVEFLESLKEINNLNSYWAIKMGFDICQVLKGDEKVNYLKFIERQSSNSLNTEFLFSLGVLKMEESQWKEAELIYQKALKSTEQKHEPNQRLLSKIYNQLGMIKTGQGLFNDGLDYYFKSSKILEIGSKGLNAETANAKNNIALSYHYLGEFKHAHKYYHQALDIYKKLFGEIHEKTALLYHNIGGLFNSQGLFEKAIEYTKKSVELRSILFTENHKEVASSYISLSSQYIEIDLPSEALGYSKLALEIRKKLYTKDHSVIANSYLHLGFIYLEIEEYEKSLNCSQKALKMLLNIFGEDHNEVANAYNSLGMVYNKANQPEKAIEYYHKSIKLLIKLYGEGHSNLVVPYYDLGTIYKNY